MSIKNVTIYRLSLRSLLEMSDLAGDGVSQFLLEGVDSSSSSHDVRDGVLRPDIITIVKK